MTGLLATSAKDPNVTTAEVVGIVAAEITPTEIQ
jgi:hypothetical protein